MEENDLERPTGRTGAQRGGRMTHTELKAMRAVQTKSVRFEVALMQKTQAFFGEIISFFMGLVPGHKHSPCEINGHVLPKSWDGDYPVCTHCGREIRSMEELSIKR